MKLFTLNDAFARFVMSYSAHLRNSIIYVVQLLFFISSSLLAAGQLYADPPRILHTTFEQYARQQQQYDQQLMESHTTPPNNRHTTKAQAATGTAFTQPATPTKPATKKSTVKENSTTVNINQADALSLANALIGIGPAKAKAIVDYRKQYGAFKRMEDLMLVKGIGPATLDKNRDRLRLD